MMSNIIVSTDVKVEGKKYLGFEIRERILRDESSYSLFTYFINDGIIEEKKEETFSSIEKAYRKYTQYLGSYKPIEGIKRLKSYEDWQGCVWVSNLLGVDIESV